MAWMVLRVYQGQLAPLVQQASQDQPDLLGSLAQQGLLALRELPDQPDQPVSRVQQVPLELQGQPGRQA